MSFRASRWATRQTAASATAKLVLLVLAEAADDDGFTFLGQEEIARRAQLTRRAVLAQLARLEAAGLIRRTRRCTGYGHRTSDAIHLQMGTAVQGEGDAPRPGAQVKEVRLGLGEPHASLGEPDDAPTCTTFTGIGQITVSEPSVPAQRRQAAPRRKPETQVPEGFPGPHDLTWARERAATERRRLDPEREAERFRNHALQTDRRCRDWSAAWRNWITLALPKCPPSATAARARPETDPWPARVRGFAKNRYWRTDEWGPKPGRPGCRAPAEALAEHGWPGAG